MSLALLGGVALLCVAGWFAWKGQGADAVVLDPPPPVTVDPHVRAAPRGEPEDPGAFPMLATTSPSDVRTVADFCARARLGDIPGLRYAALRAADPVVVNSALSALVRLGAFLDDPLLLDLLGDPRPEVRQNATVALGRTGDPAAVDLLIPILEGDDASQRTLAIQALGTLGGEQARAALRAFEPRADPRELAFLRAALAR